MASDQYSRLDALVDTINSVCFRFKPENRVMVSALMFLAGLDEIYGEDRRTLDDIEMEEADAQ